MFALPNSNSCRSTKNTALTTLLLRELLFDVENGSQGAKLRVGPNLAILESYLCLRILRWTGCKLVKVVCWTLRCWRCVLSWPWPSWPSWAVTQTRHGQFWADFVKTGDYYSLQMSTVLRTGDLVTSKNASLKHLEAMTSMLRCIEQTDKITPHKFPTLGQFQCGRILLKWFHFQEQHQAEQGVLDRLPSWGWLSQVWASAKLQSPLHGKTSLQRIQREQAPKFGWFETSSVKSRLQGLPGGSFEWQLLQLLAAAKVHATAMVWI